MASSPVTQLSADEAWELLAAAPVGRLATVLGGQPDIVPINFVVDGHSLVFRTAEGAKLLSLTVHDAVAVEADSWDGDSGWSVVAKGTAAEVSGSQTGRLDELGLRPWVPTVKLHYVRITVTEISGRRFRFGEEPERDYT